METLFLVLNFCWIYYVVEAFDIRLLSKCEPVRTNLCTSLYNETHLDRSQEDAIMEIEQYKLLVSTECAEHLSLFLCGTFLPMCTVLEKPLRPCRSLCQEVKAGCEKVLKRYARMKWPHRLRCSQFPVGSPNNLCIGKPKRKDEAIINNVSPNKRTKVTEKEIIELRCERMDKINVKKVIHEGSNCNRAVSQLILGNLCNGEGSCEFQLKLLTEGHGQPSTCIKGKIGTTGIKYQCTAHSHAKTMVLKYGHDESLFCKSASRHLNILEVQFKDNNCISPNTFCSVSQSCTGKKECNLWAKSNYLQNPCQGKNVKLIVHFECLKSRKNEEITVIKSIEEGITLQCPAPKTITIVRAEYVSQFCRNKQIHCAVDLRCEKKHKCVLTRSNLFAVKCNEARNRLSIRYTCS